MILPPLARAPLRVALLCRCYSRSLIGMNINNLSRGYCVDIISCFRHSSSSGCEGIVCERTSCDTRTHAPAGHTFHTLAPGRQAAAMKECFRVNAAVDAECVCACTDTKLCAKRRPSVGARAEVNNAFEEVGRAELRKCVELSLGGGTALHCVLISSSRDAPIPAKPKQNNRIPVAAVRRRQPTRKRPRARSRDRTTFALVRI